MTAHDPNQSPALESLGEAVFLGLDRVLIRTRESRVTSSAWCLSVRAGSGEGRISLMETSSGKVLYRGEGVFLGWSQADLGAAFRRWRPPAPPAEPDAGQFG